MYGRRRRKGACWMYQAVAAAVAQGTSKWEWEELWIVRPSKFLASRTTYSSRQKRAPRLKRESSFAQSPKHPLDERKRRTVLVKHATLPTTSPSKPGWPPSQNMTKTKAISTWNRQPLEFFIRCICCICLITLPYVSAVKNLESKYFQVMWE